MIQNKDMSALIKDVTDKYCHINGISDMRINTALIDMDGVLYDTMANHTKAWYKMACEAGIDCDPNEFYLYEGMTGAATIDMLYMREKQRHASEEEMKFLYKRKTECFAEIGIIKMMPDADKMINTLKDNNIRRVLVTGSGQGSILDRINKDYPGAFADSDKVTAHDVKHGKPNPEPYLMGMQKANAKATECMVIENAPLGVQAGHDSGAFTIAISTGPIPAEKLYDAGADIVFENMAQFVQHLSELLSIITR